MALCSRATFKDGQDDVRIMERLGGRMRWLGVRGYGDGHERLGVRGYERLEVSVMRD